MTIRLSFLSNLGYTPEFEELALRELELLGEDPAREGLLRTPARVARALKWMTQGFAVLSAKIPRRETNS